MKEDIYQQVRCDLEIIAYADKCADIIRILVITHQGKLDGSYRRKESGSGRPAF